MERGLIGFFGKQFASNGEKRRIWRQPEILGQKHVIERPITVHYEDSDKSAVFGEFLLIAIAQIFFYYPEERDEKGELIKAGHHMLLRRTTLLSQPKNEKVYSLGNYVAVRSETNDWLMCVISEINDPSKEVKVRFMRKSGQYFLQSKKLEKWFPKPGIFHRCSITSIDNHIRYSSHAIDTKGICDKIKTYTRQRLHDGPSYLQITAEMNVTKASC